MGELIVLAELMFIAELVILAELKILAHFETPCKVKLYFFWRHER